MKKGYVKDAKQSSSGMKKGYANNVNVVNTPTVRIKHDGPMKDNPTLHIGTDDLAAIKDWKIGQTYKLSVEVEMTGINKRTSYDLVGGDEDSADEKGMSASFNIKNIKEA